MVEKGQLKDLPASHQPNPNHIFFCLDHSVSLSIIWFLSLILPLKVQSLQNIQSKHLQRTSQITLLQTFQSLTNSFGKNIWSSCHSLHNLYLPINFISCHWSPAPTYELWRKLRFFFLKDIFRNHNQHVLYDKDTNCPNISHKVLVQQ